MPEAPEQQPVGRGVHLLDVADAPQEDRQDGQGSRDQGEEGQDGRDQEGEGEQRQGAHLPLQPRGDDVDQEVQHGHQGAHRVQQHHAVEPGRGLQRRVGREHDRGLTAEHGIHDPHGAHQHHDVGHPAHSRRREPAAEQDAAAEEQAGHLEEQDPEDEHRRAMGADQTVEPFRVGDQVYLGPAGEGDQQGQGAAEGQIQHGGDGVEDDEALRRAVNCQARDLAGPPVPADRIRAHGVTSIRPSMRWCPGPQYSLQTIWKVPDSLGVSVIAVT